MRYGGNPDNIWKRETSLNACLQDRINSFGSLETYLKFMRRYVMNAGIFPYGRALDAGCDEALVSIELASTGLIQYLTLLDKFPQILEKNRKYIADKHTELSGRVSFIVKDLCKECIDEKYNLVLALTIIRASELKSGSKKVENIFNFVDNKGTIIMSVPLKADGNEFSDYKKLIIREGIEKLMNSYDIQFLETAMSKEELWVTGKKD